MALQFRNPSDCAFDIVTLGECMIRFSPPGHGRIEFARTMEVDVGGGEFNVGYACARLGLRSAFVSKLPDTPLARIALNHARAAGVDVSNVVMENYDGVGRRGRVGLNFTEVGMGVRPSVTLYDRGHSSISLMRPNEIDWRSLFGTRGTLWFHTGGIMAGLSDTSATVTLAAVKAAHEAGVVTSYDLNYRSKLWRSEKAIAITKEILPYVDTLIGNEEDFQKALGLTVEGTDEHLSRLPLDSYKSMVLDVLKIYPNIRTICTTLREVKSGLINNWSGIMWHANEFYASRRFENMEIEDRVGGGDGFSSGIVCGFLRALPPQEIVDFAASHGALLQTTRGDTSQIDAQEIIHVVRGGSARIQR